MKTETEIRAKLAELTDAVRGMAWWDDEKAPMLTIIDTLRWTLGEIDIPI